MIEDSLYAEVRSWHSGAVVAIWIELLNFFR